MSEWEIDFYDEGECAGMFRITRPDGTAFDVDTSDGDLDDYLMAMWLAKFEPTELTDEQINGWRDRHSLRGSLSLFDSRVAIGDAQSLHLTRVAPA